jgi:guanylate kinase
MDTKAIKKEIIDRILVFDDQEFLEEINSLLQSRQSERYIEISSELEVKLNLSSDQIKQGNFIEQDELDKAVEEWLNEE